MAPLLDEDWSGSGVRLRRGEARQGRGTIRHFRKPYNCCPGPGWPLRRHCWTKTGPAQARRSLSRPRCHTSLSESLTAVLGLAGHCGHWRERLVGLRRGEVPYNSWAWLATVAIGGKIGSGARSLSRPRCHPSLWKPYNCWAWLATVAPLLDEDWSGSGAARPFKGEVPSVAFGNHIIAVLGLAGHCGHWWENLSGSGAAKPFKAAVPSVAFGNHIIAVLGLAGHCGAIAGRRLVRLRRPAQARRGLSRARCHPSLSETI